jgi:outer membrane lipoprotein-sorting protein
VKARVAMIFALLVLLRLIGCAPREHIPTYPNLSVAESLRVMRERSAKIHDVSGEGAITLIDPRGRSVRLDGAFVFAPPDRARVRAWKFGQAVLDLTVTTDATYLFLPRQDAHADQLRGASHDTGRAVRQWLTLLAQGFDQSALVSESNTSLIIEESVSVRATVDRKTLTPRRYVALDEHGRARFTLTLDQYRVIDDVVWPMRIEAKSSGGVVRIELREVELNRAPAGAFAPPARAERLP